MAEVVPFPPKLLVHTEARLELRREQLQVTALAIGHAEPNILSSMNFYETTIK